MFNYIKETIGGFLYIFIKWFLFLFTIAELCIFLATFAMAFISWDNVCRVIEVNHIWFAARVAAVVPLFVALVITLMWSMDDKYANAWHKFRNINRYCWIIFLPILLSGCGSEQKVFYDCSEVRNNLEYVKSVHQCQKFLENGGDGWRNERYESCLAATQRFFCKPYTICEVKPKGEGVSK